MICKFANLMRAVLIAFATVAVVLGTSFGAQADANTAPTRVPSNTSSGQLLTGYHTWVPRTYTGTSTDMPMPTGYVYNPSIADEPERHDYCTKSPDSYGYANFKAPCAGHDLCYDIDGNREFQKKKCDAQFHENLNHQCAMSYSGWSENLRPFCYDQANTYKYVVTHVGVGATWAKVFKLPYNDDVLTSTGGSAPRVIKLSAGVWNWMGNPGQLASPTQFVKYPWSDSIYAVTFWAAGERFWQWKHITGAEWAKAGNPAPRVAGWIYGSDFYKYRNSPDIYVRGADGVVHKLTGAEWAASGYRAYRTI